jgi:hypothetical protein
MGIKFDRGRACAPFLRQGGEGDGWGQPAMPIISFPKQGVFDPEATAAMGEAFDAACEELHCTTQPEVIRELIAMLIIATASRGELDPVRLRMVAVAGFAARNRRDPAASDSRRSAESECKGRVRSG